MPEQVAVIATVLNEAHSVGALLRSLAEQTRGPDEVVIVDGGSCDGTLELLQQLTGELSLPARILSRPGAGISAGRNAAIGATACPLIAATDAGVCLEPGWLEALVAPFDAREPPDVVSGVFVPAPTTVFETALAAVTLPLPEEIVAESFHPSSRSVAFRRRAWEQVGGYPEWLDYCEDLLFDFALRDAGYRFALAREARAHYRPRPTLRAYWRQYYRYARGDGKADFWRWRHAVRYGTYLVAGPALVALAAAHHPLWLLGIAAGLAAMMRRPLLRLPRLWGGLRLAERLAALAWLPLLRLLGDAAKMVGYPVGVAWRWRHAPAGPWPKRQW